MGKKVSTRASKEKAAKRLAAKWKQMQNIFYYECSCRHCCTRTLVMEGSKCTHVISLQGK